MGRLQKYHKGITVSTAHGVWEKEKSQDDQKLLIFLCVWRELFICLFVVGGYLFLSEWLEGWSLKQQDTYMEKIIQVQVWAEEMRTTRDLALYTFRQRCLSGIHVEMLRRHLDKQDRSSGLKTTKWSHHWLNDVVQDKTQMWDDKLKDQPQEDS